MLWPPHRVRVETPTISLLPTIDERVEHLARLGAGNILQPEESGWLGEWAELSEPEFSRGFLQFHAAAVGSWSPERWQWHQAIVLDDEPIGVMSLVAEEFSASKTVATGSWLLREHRGRGYGTAARRAALALAFGGLSAEWATTSYHPDNLASAGVTRRLGYRPNGISRQSHPAGGALEMQHALLRREEYVADEDILVVGLDDEVLALCGVSPA